jgi:putative selenium metabolism hydrolase
MSGASAVPEISAEAVADFTLRMVRIPSPSGQEGGVARLVLEEMVRLGFDARIDDWGNVVGSIEAGAGPRVLLDAHTDTVGVTEGAAWSRDPWGERAGNRLYGRGSADMKGPLAAALYGVAALRDGLRHGAVFLSASVAEELVEGPALQAVAEQVQPDYVIICESTGLQVARGQRGRAEVRIEVEGQPTHSSRPDLGVNAAEAMVDIALALRSILPPRHPVLGPGILVLTDMKSEPYPALSVVPDRCIATYDRRTLPGEREDDVLGPVRRAIDHALSRGRAKGRASIATDDFTTYTGRHVTAPNFAPAWFFNEDAEIVAVAAGALEDAGFDPTLGHYAFCTNGSGTAGRMGIPTIGFGPGSEEVAHRVDEYIEIAQLADAARGYAAIVRRLIHGQSVR